MARPKQENAQDTRQLALDAVADLIHLHGYNGVSMNALAKAVGVRKASLYHHFPEGKEQLVLEMLERMIHHHSVGYQAAIDKGASVAERLEAIFRFSQKEAAGLSSIVVDSVRFLSEEHQTHVSALFFENQYERIRSVLADGVTAGELREHDVTLSTWMFLSSMSELGRVTDLKDANLAKRVVRLFLGGLERA